MKLLTEEIRKKIPPLYSQENVKDPIVHVKFFTPWTNWTWYATEFDGKDLFFGYVVGLEKELGYFSLSEMESIRGPVGLGIERDMHFVPKPLSEVMAEHGEKLKMPQVRPGRQTVNKGKKGPLYPHVTKSKEPLFPHTTRGQVSRLPQTELRDKARELWVKACEWEKIPPDSKFVIFSEDNPYMKEYHEAMGRLLRFKQVQSGQWRSAVTIVQRLPQTEAKRTAYYVQYWSPESDPENAQPYYWKTAFKTLYEALDEATECERKKPDAFGIDVYSREERWEPFEENPRYGSWEGIEDTVKTYDRKGRVTSDERQPSARLPQTSHPWQSPLREYKDHLELLYRWDPDEFYEEKKLIGKAIKERNDGLKKILPQFTLGGLRSALNFCFSLYGPSALPSTIPPEHRHLLEWVNEPLPPEAD